MTETNRHDKARRVCVFPHWHRLPAWEPVLLERNFHSPCVLVGCQESGSDHHDQITVTTPQTLPEAVETMDKEKEDAALDETVEMIVANVIHGATEQFIALQKKEKEAEYVAKNIQWTTCKDFTVEGGRQQIEEYISTWEFHERWLHWSEFLCEEELTYSKMYHYRVLWSIPTRRKPIPQATASVYFVIEISKIKPDTFPVEVFFFLESSRLIFRPEYCRFREKWLKDIIINKLSLKQRLAFK
ncbi:A-kinase anchor protein 14 [Anas acuta]|uniref:A-kinase anchor protein 14 n=1 Tax=Anas acuta TaxID=28680 RepID=UPI0035C8F110